VVIPLSDYLVSEAMIFGKLPFHGDFVARGLTGSEQIELDGWLSRSMAEAREQLGTRFNDCFDAAAPWFFAWEGKTWTAGAMAPSVDSAGRRFPLIAGLRNLEKGFASTACERCEEALFEAVSERRSVDELATKISSASLTPGGSAVEEGWWQKEPEHARIGERLPLAILTRMIGVAA
jgi:type VI secretion system protein ImpM